MTVEERLRALYQHLGIDRAHVAGRLPRDWGGIAQVYPKMLSSLTLVGPGGVDASLVAGVASHLLVIQGDRGPHAERVRGVVERLPGARFVALRDYEIIGWTDLLAERGDDIAAAMEDVIAHTETPESPRLDAAVAREGEIAGISYRIEGSGPPLMLLPLWLSPSQWEPIVPRLRARFATITLGGRFLGATAFLESRGRAAGYRRMLTALIDEMQIAPGGTILDVGCGTGVIDRWLVSRTSRRTHIVGVDINRYLLREASALARSDGMQDVIEFREGSAEHLPFAGGAFDATISVTVIEEVDADRMLSEMIRVTKPGGRVAVVSRAMDLPWMMNVPLDADLKRQVEAPGIIGNVEPHGCADASLYRRLVRAGLTNVTIFPATSTFDAAEPDVLRGLQDMLFTKLDPDKASAWRRARETAETEGTFFIAMPHHCAIGTKS